MPISAKDKVVIITGGAGEMGSSIARRLVDEGAKVVIADIADGSALADELSQNGRRRLRQDRRDLRRVDRSDGAGRHRRLRSHRRPGQQRRAVHRQTLGRADPRRLAGAVRGQCRGHLSRHQSGRPGDDRAGAGQDHQYRLRYGLDGDAGLRPLRGEQGRGAGLHPRHRHRARSARHHQRLRDADAPGDTRHPRGIPAGPLRLRAESHARSGASRSRRTSTG